MDEAPNAEDDVPVPADSTAIPAPRGFAVRLPPAASPGSWVDVISLPDGRKGVVLGCCAEPAVADRVRSDARESLRRTGDPVSSLDRVDGLPVSAVGAVIGATTIAYRTHGDSAAVVVPDSRPPDRRDGDLVVCDLAPGATVLLSTAPIAGAAALLGSSAALHPDRLADLLVPGANGTGSDAAVLYRHPPDPMAITLPAAPANLAVSRERLRAWLAEAGLDSESCADVLLAVGEATANATEHSVVGAGHEVRLTVSAALSGNLLQLAVSDDGRWKPATGSQGHRGHGMQLINALVDSVELTTTPDGTTVAMLKEVP